MRNNRWQGAALLILLLLMAGLACGGKKLYLNQTFQFKLEPLMVGPDKTISLQSGEVIDLSPILETEAWPKEGVIVTRKYNNYFLTADGFKFLYMIEPCKKEFGKYTAIDPTPDNELDFLRAPQLDPRIGDCLTLTWQSDTGMTTLYLDYEGDFSDASCLNVPPSK